MLKFMLAAIISVYYLSNSNNIIFNDEVTCFSSLKEETFLLVNLMIYLSFRFMGYKMKITKKRKDICVSFRIKIVLLDSKCYLNFLYKRITSVHFLFFSWIEGKKGLLNYNLKNNTHRN